MSDADDFIERNRITSEQYQRLVGTDFALPAGWKHNPGCAIQAPISWRNDYVIPHRGDEGDGGQGHNVSYRPPRQHHHVGRYATAAAGPWWFAVDVSPGQEWASIVVASEVDGRVRVEVKV